MAVNNGQFDYPQRGWSTGKMRKRGQRPDETQVAMDYQRRGEPQSALVEMERAAGFGLAARGGMTAATTIPQGAAGQAVGGNIADHRAQIQDAVNQVATGDLTSQGLKKLIKRLGWTNGKDANQYTDPTGQDHTIAPTPEAQ